MGVQAARWLHGRNEGHHARSTRYLRVYTHATSACAKRHATVRTHLEERGEVARVRRQRVVVCVVDQRALELDLQGRRCG